MEGPTNQTNSQTAKTGLTVNAVAILLAGAIRHMIVGNQVAHTVQFLQ